MVYSPVACWALVIIAAACELLAAFGIDVVGQVHLIPLGLVFVALSIAVAVHHPHA